MDEQWTIMSLKEYFERLLNDSEKSLDHKIAERREDVERRFRDREEYVEHRFAERKEYIERRFLEREENLKLMGVYYETLLKERDKNVHDMREASDKAIAKAEVANEKRFESVNEFRKTLADQSALFLPKNEYYAQHNALDEKVASANRTQNMLIGGLILISFAMPAIMAWIVHIVTPTGPQQIQLQPPPSNIFGPKTHLHIIFVDNDPKT